MCCEEDFDESSDLQPENCAVRITDTQARQASKDRSDDFFLRDRHALEFHPWVYEARVDAWHAQQVQV